MCTRDDWIVKPVSMPTARACKHLGGDAGSDGYSSYFVPVCVVHIWRRCHREGKLRGRYDITIGNVSHGERIDAYFFRFIFATNLT